MAELLALRDAVAELVRDGDTVAMEGFTHLVPNGAGYEVNRQGRKELTLVRMTPDLIYDQLIGMGCARKLVFSWGGNPGVGSLRRLRDAVEQGCPQQLELEEHDHAALANEPDPASKELTVTSVHPGVTREQIVEATAWEARFAADVATTKPPSAEALAVLRDLQARTRRAHGEAA